MNDFFLCVHAEIFRGQPKTSFMDIEKEGQVFGIGSGGKNPFSISIQQRPVVGDSEGDGLFLHASAG